MAKTAVTVLQELMVKMGHTPEYDCVSQSGPQHLSTFEYRCQALGELVTATARSKKEAKQEVAKLMLFQLARRGHRVPPPYNSGPQLSTQQSSASKKEAEPSIVGSHSYVVLLKDLCEEYHLPGVEYTLIGDTGPPHMREFTIRVRIGQHERTATSTTKKAARQMAAEQLYKYMRENLHRVTKDFTEEEALVRAHERAMDRYVEMRDPELVWRPDLGQKIADYPIGLKTHIDPEKCQLARTVLSSLDEIQSSDPQVVEAALTATAAALGLTINWSELQAERGKLQMLELTPTSPALAFAGENKQAAVAQALRYLRLAL
ncbi:hypothetical protein O0L34_g8754 [Tuta absoluta]|nr:hypothetical protein O0L34_g8754 [Tuta absoluta]